MSIESRTDPTDRPTTLEETTPDADAVVDAAVRRVDAWLRRAEGHRTRRSRRTARRLRGIVADPAGLRFVMAYIDRVARPDDHRVAAAQLRSLVTAAPLPGFLSPVDQALLRLGARLAPLVPAIVMPLAGRRMRSIVGHLVAPAEPERLHRDLDRQRGDGWASNVNLLGEAVLGDAEAGRRRERLLELVDDPAVDYVSTKPSAVVAQLDRWDPDGSLDRVTEALAEIVDRGARATPSTFVNVDMEEYHDLHLTLEAFRRVLDHPDRLGITAGIVVQAYLPDALGVLTDLAAWAADRVDGGGAPIKVRLVKGANQAMELVEAELHDWEPPTYDTKAETDANYVRCLDAILHPERLGGLRLGVASHNLFHVAWVLELAHRRGVLDRIQFEMLQGMAEAEVAAASGELAERTDPLLYTPAVRSEDFDVAIAYLFRRLDENAAPDNFLRSLLDLTPDSPTFELEADRFRASVRDRHRPALGPRRTQNRLVDEPATDRPDGFRNEPLTDPALRSNRAYLDHIRSTPAEPTPIADPVDVEALFATLRTAQRHWWARPADERAVIVRRVGDELARRRDRLFATMAAEAHKIPEQADGEIAEAIDFARYYGDRATELVSPVASFEPFGVVSVVPPWNFPVAIPAGGVLAALAAGNAVVFKPAPEVRACAAIVVEAIRAAGVPDDLVAFRPIPDGTESRALVELADAVILTGSSETASMFRSWRPDLRLFAETSGKNALVITPHADIDLAVTDLVASAFGHSGQKCSAASLAIGVGGVFDNPRVRRQLVDAVQGLVPGSATTPGVRVTPLVGGTNDRLRRALTELEPGASWLIEPERLTDDLWRPGVLVGVGPDSWFRHTECFGPVLGLVRADDLDQAIDIQNAGSTGLTGGIHSLDPDEIDRWVDRVEVGNAYVNRAITGAIVQRQPFGGWKGSSVGPGAKAGGPNYAAQLGTWRPAADPGAMDPTPSTWAGFADAGLDPAGLRGESNVFRYRPLRRVLLRLGANADPNAVAWFRAAATALDVEIVESVAVDESETELIDRLDTLDIDRIRIIGTGAGPELRLAAHHRHLHVADHPVVADPLRTGLDLVREQSVSRTLHRFGNLPRSRGQVA